MGHNLSYDHFLRPLEEPALAGAATALACRDLLAPLLSPSAEEQGRGLSLLVLQELWPLTLPSPAKVCLHFGERRGACSVSHKMAASAVLCTCVRLDLCETQLHQTLMFFMEMVTVKALGLEKDVWHLLLGRSSDTHHAAQAAPRLQGKKTLNHGSPHVFLSAAAEWKVELVLKALSRHFVLDSLGWNRSGLGSSVFLPRRLHWPGSSTWAASACACSGAGSCMVALACLAVWWPSCGRKVGQKMLPGKRGNHCDAVQEPSRSDHRCPLSQTSTETSPCSSEGGRGRWSSSLHASGSQWSARVAGLWLPHHKPLLKCLGNNLLPNSSILQFDLPRISGRCHCVWEVAWIPPRDFQSPREFHVWANREKGCRSIFVLRLMGDQESLE